MTIAVVDYGAGNLASVLKAFAAAGATARIVDRVAALSEMEAIVIPGVGHFGATQSIDEVDRQAIRARVAAGAPLLGICLGMQWLFEGSDEAPDRPGLGLLPGRCARLRGDVKIPHVGWNTLDPTGPPARLLDGLPSGVSAYFTHAYGAPVGAAAAAVTTHGTTFASVVECDRVFGTQFHPEKSGVAGVRMLANFVAIAREAGAGC